MGAQIERIRTGLRGNVQTRSSGMRGERARAVRAEVRALRPLVGVCAVPELPGSLRSRQA